MSVWTENTGGSGKVRRVTHEERTQLRYVSDRRTPLMPARLSPHPPGGLSFAGFGGRGVNESAAPSVFL
jgi:hypothetical protein